MQGSVDLSYDDNVDDALALRRMLESIDRCPAPVVARVQGHALLGGGCCDLVACADVAVAAADAVFGFSEVKLGIVPAVISPFALAKIGRAAAATSSPASGSMQRRRCGSKMRPGDGRRSRRRGRRRAPQALTTGTRELPAPPAPRAGRTARRCRDRAPHRRAPDERRGAGGIARVPGAAALELGTEARRLIQIDRTRARMGAQTRRRIARLGLRALPQRTTHSESIDLSAEPGHTYQRYRPARAGRLALEAPRARGQATFPSATG